MTDWKKVKATCSHKKGDSILGYGDLSDVEGGLYQISFMDYLGSSQPHLSLAMVIAA